MIPKSVERIVNWIQFFCPFIIIKNFKGNYRINTILNLWNDKNVTDNIIRGLDENVETSIVIIIIAAMTYRFP